MFKCYLKEISRNLGLNILNKFSVEIYRIGSYSYYDHDPLKVPTPDSGMMTFCDSSM